MQKEQFSLLDNDGKPSLFAPVMLATLSTCAQLERDNITFRLQSGRKQYIAKGGKLGRKPGSVKTLDQKKEEYKDVIALLKKGYAIRDVAKLSGKGISTVQRVKKVFC
jgi:DNA invertase Pin-like site-specific DNA recombinase